MMPRQSYAGPQRSRGRTSWPLLIIMPHPSEMYRNKRTVRLAVVSEQAAVGAVGRKRGAKEEAEEPKSPTRVAPASVDISCSRGYVMRVMDSQLAGPTDPSR